MAVATELVTEFSYQGSEAPLNRYNQSLNSSITLLASMTAALAAAGAAVGKWASGVLEGERDLFNLSYTTGIAIERIQQLSFTAEMMGASSQAMQSSLESLSATIGDAAQKGSEDFARLGIAVRDASGQVRSADDVLFDVQRRFKQLNLSMAEQQSFAGALGIDTSLLRMLNQTDAQMASMMQRASELGTLNEEQSKQAERYNQALTAQRFTMDGLRRLIAVGLAPELTRLVDGFAGLIERNREWIIDGVRNTMGILNDFMEMIGRVWPVLAAGAGYFIALKVATYGWNAALYANPIFWITGLIVGLLLVVDDLIVAFRGGKSIIRDFFQEFFGVDITPILQNMVADVKEVFGQIKDIAGDVISSIADMFRGIGQLIRGDLVGAWESFGEAGQKQVDAITSEAAKGLADRMTQAQIDRGGWLTMPRNFQKKMKDLLNIGTDKPVEDRSMFEKFMWGWQERGGGSTVNQDVQINVRSNDPERAARLTGDALQRQLDDAQTQTDRGGR